MRKQNRNSKYRSNKGQVVITEGIFGLSLILPAFIALLFVLVNLYVAAMAQRNLQVVADMTAEAFNARRFWLGTARVGFDSEEAKRQATQVGTALAANCGLPPVTLAFNRILDGDVQITQVSATVRGLALPIPDLNVMGTPISFPTLGLSATGQAIDVAQAPFATVTIGMPVTPGPFGENAPNSTRRVAAIPALAFGDQLEGAGGAGMWDNGLGWNTTGIGNTLGNGDMYIMGFEARGHCTDEGSLHPGTRPLTFTPQ